MPDRNSNLEPEIRELPSYAEHYATMLGAIYGREGWQALNSRFSLFSFAIYDASIHADFDQQVKQLLFSGDSEKLEDDFMGFLAFANPWDYELPDYEGSSRERGRDRKQGDNLAAYNRECAIPLIHSIVRTDSAIAAGALAAVLSIPQNRLPCLVVSSNLHSSGLSWFSTDRTWLGDQLYRLRDVSQIVREFGTFSRERIIHDHIQQTNGYGEKGVVRLRDKSPFGSQLITVMNATVAGHSPFEKHRDEEEAKKQLLSLQMSMKKKKESLRERNESLDRLEQVVQEAPERDEGMAIIDSFKKGFIEDNDDFEGYCQKIASLLASLHTANPIDIKHFIAVDEADLEEETIRMLKTAYAVLDMVQKYESIGLDYTPAVMCLAKVFEREINLSVVHWVRKELNIDLPAFFDRFQPNQEAKLEGVNFNNGEAGSWQAPMLGQSKKALDNSAYTTPSCSIPVNWAVLSPEWKKIIDNRNAGAHEPVVKECVVKEIKDALDTLTSKGVFDQLQKIKTDLRKETPVPSVHVPDKKLREAIAKELELAITVKNIPAKDMARLGTLRAEGLVIKDLTGLGKAKGLQKLFLKDNEIENLEALKNLNSLEKLELNNNSIKDKDLQHLKDLKKLVNLNLANNEIEDLTALIYLDSENNEIKKNLENLKFLGLKGNCINKSKQKEILDILESGGCTVSL